MGTDMVLDKIQGGPMVLELNARPGLAIQTANGCGLLPPRLHHIENLGTPNTPPPSPAERVAYAAEQFGAKSLF